MTTETGAGPDVLARIAREYLDVRDAANDLTRRRDALRKQLLPLLEDAGGQYTDEIAGVRLVVERQVRWDYDATTLHECVKAQVLAAEFADCLETTVKKDVVQGWIDRGLVRGADVTAAKVGSKVIPQIQVEPIGGRRP